MRPKRTCKWGSGERCPHWKDASIGLAAEWVPGDTTSLIAVQRGPHLLCGDGRAFGPVENAVENLDADNHARFGFGQRQRTYATNDCNGPLESGNHGVRGHPGAERDVGSQIPAVQESGDAGPARTLPSVQPHAGPDMLVWKTAGACEARGGSLAF